MRITAARQQTELGLPGWFTGAVYLDELAVLDPPSRLRTHNVHFTPGARSAWHRHPVGQVLVVTDGIGRVQRRGGPVEEIRQGDTIHVEPGEWHWHGAAPTAFMTHLAIQEADAGGGEADWGPQVTDDEYLVPPRS